jgi:hypothetical protein
LNLYDAPAAAEILREMKALLETLT